MSLNTRSNKTPEIDDYAYIMSNDGTVNGKVELQDITDIPETTRTINFTSSQTAAQIQADIDEVGKYIPKGVTITFKFGNGTYTLDAVLFFQGFYGGGTLNVYGDTSQTDGLHTNHNVHLNFTGSGSSGIYCIHNSNRLINIRHLKVTTDDGFICVVLQRECSYRVWYCYLISTAKTSGATFGIRAIDGVNAWLLNNYLSNNYYGIGATLNSKVISVDNDDTGTQPRYGLHARQASTLGKNGTQPAGSVYVGGIFITQLPNMSYAYNFKPEHVSLDRDRKVPRSYDVEYTASKIIEGWDKLSIQDLGRRDATYISTIPKSIKEKFIPEIINKEVVFVADGIKAPTSAYDNLKVFHRNKIKKLKIDSNRTRKPENLLKNFYEKYNYRFNEDQKTDFEVILQASKKWVKRS